jgi:hypothetical protein
MEVGLNGKRGAVLAAIALLCGTQPASSLAQSEPFWKGIASEGPAAASSGDLAVLQTATTNPDKLTADWLNVEEGTDRTTGFDLHNDARTTRNKPIVTFIVFRGCRPNSYGNCNLTADYNVVGPDGKPYAEAKLVQLWVDRPPPPSQNLELSASGFALVFEPKDALGDYRVHAIISDHVAGITLNTEQVLTLTGTTSSKSQ